MSKIAGSQLMWRPILCNSLLTFFVFLFGVVVWYFNHIACSVSVGYSVPFLFLCYEVSVSKIGVFGGCVTTDDMNLVFLRFLKQQHQQLTYLLTPWSRVLLEKLTGCAVSQEIPRIFGTRRLITVLTSTRHLSLSWANSIQSLQPPLTSWRSILILSSHLRLGLPNGLFPSGFPTRTLCTPLPSPYAPHALPISFFSILNNNNNNNNNVNVWYRGYLTLQTLSPATAKWRLLFYVPDYYIGLWSDNPENS